MDSPLFILTVRKRLSFLLAKAACEVFPDAQVVSIQGTDEIFFADICFSQEFDKAFLPLIEGRFQALIQTGSAIKQCEMVAASARGVLKKARQDLQALQLPADPRLLHDIALLGEFALLSPGDIEEEGGQDGPRYFWELISAEEGGEVAGRPVIRIIGIACENLTSLKACKKNWSRFPYTRPGQLAEKGGYLAACSDSSNSSLNNVWLWLPRGETVRQRLQQSWQKLVEQEGFFVVSTGGRYPLEQGLQEIISCLGPQPQDVLRLAEASYVQGESEQEGEGEFQSEGILTPCGGWTDRLVRICPQARVREECISSLQFILKIPRMLSFNAQVVLCSSLSGDTKDLRAAAEAAGVDYRWEKSSDRPQPSIEVRFSDRLGREWLGPSVWIAKWRPLPGYRMVFSSCMGKWERLVGLLIEKNGGTLPTWQVPEKENATVMKSPEKK